MSNPKTTSGQILNREKLQSIYDRAEAVINGLSENGAWQIVLEDFKKQCDDLNNNWQFVNDEKKMYEFKITKLAAMSVVNLIDNYKFNRDRAAQELQSITDPKNNIQKDVDDGEDHKEGIQEGDLG